jgi:prepilin-type N-terminal cleavage/methylation domain-containing protein
MLRRGASGSPGSPGAAGWRRGLTLLEVIAATMLLAGLASIVLGAVSFMEASNARERHRLQAMEVAHRIVAQYIDNPKLLPDETVPIQHGESFYLYTLQEDVLTQSQDAGSNIRKAIARKKQDLSVEEALPHMLNRITIRVYVDDPDAPVLDARRPAAELVRIFDPIMGRPQDVVLEELLKLMERVQAEQSSRGREGSR